MVDPLVKEGSVIPFTNHCTPPDKHSEMYLYNQQSKPDQSIETHSQGIKCDKLSEVTQYDQTTPHLLSGSEVKTL